MTDEDILAELAKADYFPRAALKAASERRSELIPVFIREIETYLAVDPKDRPDDHPLFFIFHTLSMPLTRL